MKIFRGFRHSQLAPHCALTIGNFDGVHRGHQAMLALLRNEARHRGLPSCALTFEPHPRDFFAEKFKKPDLRSKKEHKLRRELVSNTGRTFRSRCLNDGINTGRRRAVSAGRGGV